MKHTETNNYDVSRLLHVKGNKRVTAREVRHASRCFCWCGWYDRKSCREQNVFVLICFRWR